MEISLIPDASLAFLRCIQFAQHFLCLGAKKQRMSHCRLQDVNNTQLVDRSGKDTFPGPLYIIQDQLPCIQR